MAGSTLGTIFRISTWGESHGKALGVVIDGCPAGLELSEADIQPFLNPVNPSILPLVAKTMSLRFSPVYLKDVPPALQSL